MQDNHHFAHVRKLVERKFADGDDSIELEAEEICGKKTVCICVTSRFGDSACVDFKADSTALRDFAAAINEVMSKYQFADVGKMVARMKGE